MIPGDCRFPFRSNAGTQQQQEGLFVVQSEAPREPVQVASSAVHQDRAELGVRVRSRVRAYGSRAAHRGGGDRVDGGAGRQQRPQPLGVPAHGGAVHGGAARPRPRLRLYVLHIRLNMHSRTVPRRCQYHLLQPGLFIQHHLVCRTAAFTQRVLDDLTPLYYAPKELRPAIAQKQLPGTQRSRSSLGGPCIKAREGFRAWRGCFGWHACASAPSASSNCVTESSPRIAAQCNAVAP